MLIKVLADADPHEVRCTSYGGDGCSAQMPTPAHTFRQVGCQTWPIRSLRGD
jgi:hypothetical protein